MGSGKVDKPALLLSLNLCGLSFPLITLNLFFYSFSPSMSCTSGISPRDVLLPSYGTVDFAYSSLP